MHRFPGSFLFLAAQIAICAPCLALSAVAASAVQLNPALSHAANWTSSNAQHVYGLPDTKPNDRGTLLLTPEGLAFAGKSASVSVERSSIIAVSGGNERVELWGTTGRIVRMLIPNGGGLFAAGVMHHRVDMLTVEFSDRKGGYHSAVFVLPAHEAEYAMQSFAQFPAVQHEQASPACQGQSVQPKSVLVRVSARDQVNVPPAYRALVYEHLIDRLQHMPGMSHIYREGESYEQAGCPQYTVDVAITGFKAGSQVVRAATGPVGMFAAPTQLTMDTAFSDASGRLNTHEDLKSVVRTETESRKVADGAAKTLAKHFSAALKEFEKAGHGQSGQAAHLR